MFSLKETHCKPVPPYSPKSVPLPDVERRPARHHPYATRDGRERGMREGGDLLSWRQRREDLEREAANGRLAKALRRARKSSRTEALRWELERRYGSVSKLIRRLRTPDRRREP